MFQKLFKYGVQFQLDCKTTFVTASIMEAIKLIIQFITYVS